MFGLSFDPRLILIAGGVLLAVVLGVGAYVYHEGTTASLRAQLEKERKANAQAVERNAKLETLVRESAAEVEAANRMAAAAKAQAARNNCLTRVADRDRAINREVLHEVVRIENAAPEPVVPSAAERRARALLWTRVNDLFLRGPGPCSSADPDPCASVLRPSASP